MSSLTPHYNHWADARLVDFLKTIARPPKVDAVLAHLAMAGETWLARLEDLVAPEELWPDLPFAEAAERLIEVDRRLLVLRDEDATVRYRNSSGEEFEDTVGEILAHLFNHATYHRGEIAGLLLSKNHEPPLTDRIVYRREKG